MLNSSKHVPCTCSLFQQSHNCVVHMIFESSRAAMVWLLCLGMLYHFLYLLLLYWILFISVNIFCLQYTYSKISNNSDAAMDITWSLPTFSFSRILFWGYFEILLLLTDCTATDLLRECTFWYPLNLFH